MAAESAARRQQQQEAQEPTSLLRTPTRFRTPESKLAQRGRAVASEFSTQRKQPSDGYSFNLLPEESLPVTPGVPGSARKRKNTIASPNATMMVVDESPARYSPDKVKEAIMSFADFLRFLEGNQQEHPLMPRIIQRFSELGTVIESQKRHIDRWKQKELDLAICEAQQNLDLIRDLGTTIQKQELELASWQVEKQRWEEKYTLAAQENDGLRATCERSGQEIERLKHEGTARIQSLTAQVAQQTQQISDLERAVQARESALETLERDAAAFKSQVQQLEAERTRAAQDTERLGQQHGQQVAMLQQLEQQISELQRACATEQERASAFERDVAAWKRKCHAQEQTTAELETALESERRERGTQASSLNQVVSDARRLETQLSATRAEYEAKLATQHERMSALEASRRDAMEQLQHASDKYSALLRESTAQHEAASAAAMQQLEERFLAEKHRVGEQMQREVEQLQHQVASLETELTREREQSQRQRDELAQLMARHQELEVHGREARPEDAEAIRHLQEELEKATGDIDDLYKELSEKDELYQEDLKAQASAFETQYNDFVAQVEGQLSDSTQEAEQLRKELENVTAEYKRVLHDAEQLAIAKDDEARNWTAQCAQLQSQVEVAERQATALQRELEAKGVETRLLQDRVASLASPQSETNQHVDALERELERLQSELASKSDEAHASHVRAVEQESTHRQTIRSLYTEKEELTRSLLSLTTEKAALADATKRLEADKRALETKLRDLMTEATATLQTQQQHATLSSQDARAQLEKLSAELRQRDEQMRRGEQQLRELQSTIRTLESAQASGTAASRLEHQRALDELAARYERAKSDLMNRILEEEQRVSELQSALETDDARHHAEMTDALTQLQSAQTALEQLEEQARELERENQALTHDNAEQRRILEQAKRLEAQHTELQHIHEQLKVELAGQNADSATTIAELEEHAATLQSSLEREQQLVHELQSKHHGASSSLQAQHAEQLKTVRALREQVRSLELANEQLRRQMQTTDERRAAKEQSLLHESLEKERELRATQTRVASLERDVARLTAELADKTQQNDEWGRVLDERSADVDARHAELEAQVDDLTQSLEALQTEKQHLEDELHKADDEVAALRHANATHVEALAAKDDAIARLEQDGGSRAQQLERDVASYQRDTDELIAQLAKKDAVIDGLHDVNQTQLERLDERDSELAALSRANNDHMQQLAIKDEALDALKRENRTHASELSSLRRTLASLEERRSDADRTESVLSAKLAALQEQYDSVVAREDALVRENETLTAEKRELASAVLRDLRKLTVVSDDGDSARDASSSRVRRELAHVVELVQSYEMKQQRHETLVARKDAQIADLSAQVRSLKASVRTLETVSASVPHQPVDTSALDAELARLKRENRVLRDQSAEAASRRLADEWERNYPKLQAQVRELVDENARLKDRRRLKTQTEVKRLVDEVHALSDLVASKDAEIDALRRAEAAPASRSATTPSPRDSRRMKELMLLVQQKEKKLLVLNDHMTDLMAQAAKLQFENECYATKYGALGGPLKRPSAARVSSS